MGSLRIYGGKHHRRDIRFLSDQGIRPSGSRVRQTLFDWLRPSIRGKRCLDLLSGSGILAFEALSQGAESVVCIDVNQMICKQLQEEASRLDEQNLTIVCDSIPCKLNGQFEICFLDPPFNEQGHYQETLQWLLSKKLLAPNALLYLEADHAIEPIAPFISHNCKQVSGVFMHLWERGHDESV